MQTQTQSQTQIQTQIQTFEKAVEFLKSQLTQEGVTIKLSTPLKEEWELIVYKVKNSIEHLVLKKAKEYEEQNEKDPLRRAKEDILKRISKVEEVAMMMEKELKAYPIKFMLNIDADNNKIYVCVTLNKYIDRKTFNDFVNITKKIGLIYISGMNCKEI